jgi:flavoprotein
MRYCIPLPFPIFPSDDGKGDIPTVLVAATEDAEGCDVCVDEPPKNDVVVAVSEVGNAVTSPIAEHGAELKPVSAAMLEYVAGSAVDKNARHPE